MAATGVIVAVIAAAGGINQVTKRTVAVVREAPGEEGRGEIVVCGGWRDVGDHGGDGVGSLTVRWGGEWW